MTTPLLIVVGYLIGSIPFGFLLARRAGGIDLRRAGSGNVGAANVMRTAGTGIAVATMLLDAVKGAAAVWLAERTAPGGIAPAAAGVAAVVGHVYPVWLRWRGGKGVATAAGAFAVLSPVGTACCALLFVATVWATKYVSLGSLVSASALGPAAYLASAPTPVVLAALFTATLVVERHRGNLARLQAGTERRLGQRV